MELEVIHNKYLGVCHRHQFMSYRLQKRAQEFFMIPFQMFLYTLDGSIKIGKIRTGGIKDMK